MAAADRQLEEVSFGSPKWTRIHVLIVRQDGTEKTTQFREELPFDANLLCTKLEAAKRERDEQEAASTLRKQVRDSVRKGNHGRQRSEREWSSTTSVVDLRDRSNWYKLPPKTQQYFWQNGRQYSYPKQVHPKADIDIPEDPINTVDLTSRVAGEAEGTPVLVSPCSPTGDVDSFSQHLKRNRTMRRSFAILKDLALSSPEVAGRVMNQDDRRPTDTAKRRTQTLPILETKFVPTQRRSNTASESTDVLSPSRKRGQGPEATGGPMSGYTNSFDTCQVKEQIGRQDDHVERPRPLPIQRPSWTRSDGMRSLLNLPLMLKKDKMSVEIEELKDPWLDGEAPARRPHTRSHTAPEELISSAVSRTEKQKAKKRRTFGGLFQTILSPNYGMNHHALAI